MTGRWPIAGDTPTAILRTVVGVYRARLLAVDPDGCAVLDQQMADAGQGWAVVRTLTVDMDDWLTHDEAAKLIQVDVRRIAHLRRRGVLTGRRVGERWQYRARDVLTANAGRRRGDGNGVERQQAQM